MIQTFDEMREHLASSSKRRVAVVMSDDLHTLEAIMRAKEDGLVEPVLLGDARETERLLSKLGYNAGALDIRDLLMPQDCATAAARMARDGQVDCIMKGRIETGTIMKAMLDSNNGIRRSEIMSGIGLFETPYYHKMFAITDIALNLRPTLEHKKAILENALDVYHALGVSQPKVAVVTAVETVNPKMPETVDAEALCNMVQAGEVTGCIAAGPISVDLAMDTESATTKRYSSPVAGDADILLVPDISSGNIAAKLVTSVAHGRSCGIMVGAKVPLIVLSRSASADDKYMSIVLSALVGAC